MRTDASNAAPPMSAGFAALLWVLLVVALSPVLVDWVAHLMAEPVTRYAAVFVPLLLHLARTDSRPEARRALGLLLVVLAVLVAFVAVGGGVARLGRLAVPFAVLGMAAWIGRPGLPVAGLAFFAVPVPSVLGKALAGVLESFRFLPEALTTVDSVAGLLALAALFAGFGYHGRVLQGGGALEASRCAMASALWAFPMHALLLGAAAALSGLGEGALAGELSSGAPLYVGGLLLLLRVAGPQRDRRFTLDAETGRELVRGMQRGEYEFEKLKERPDSLTLRLWIDPESSLILKLWKRPGLAGRVRRSLGNDPANRESRALGHLQEAVIAVPAPLGCCGLDKGAGAYTDVLFLEDLGACETAFEHLKRLIREGEERRVESFLEEVVEITAGIVEKGIVDTDHSLNNLVFTEQEQLVRLDTELARRVRRLPVDAYGVMLGRLLGSFVFAVQPELDRVSGFASKLALRLGAPPPVLRRASAQVERMLSTQQARKSLETRVQLPWD